MRGTDALKGKLAFRQSKVPDFNRSKVPLRQA